MTPARQAVASPQSAALRSFEAQWHARAADPLSRVRGQAMERFLRLGLPTLRDESWRYTNLRSLAAQTYVDAPQGLPASIAAPAHALLSAAETAATVLMINGNPVLPTAPHVAIKGLIISSLRELSRTDPMLLSQHLEPLSDAEQQRWSLLNTALFLDGLYLNITGNLTAPLLILHVGAGAADGTIAYPRVIIDAAPGASATIIEQHVAQGGHPPLCNSATRIDLKRDARVEHYRVFSTGSQATHIDSLDVRQDQDSHCTQFTIVLGGGLVRTSLESQLNRAGASLDSYSLLVGHGARHADCVNIATHAAPDTRSRQTARAIASGTSRVVFNSKVIVSAGAVHADSQQSFRGLLLSPSAEIDSRPQLEIHADEVKCAHGSTTGRLDPNMLFYMLSRGLDRETAQSLLVYAFLADVLTGMSVPAARSSIESALISQLPDSHILQKFR
jgi:Fe-S cluster assembly protein SufD